MRRLRAVLDRDGGTTMTELVVVMLLLSAVVLATMTLTIGFERTTAQNVVRQEQIDDGRAAIDRMTRTLRVAVKPSQLSGMCADPCTVEAFREARAFRVQFVSNVDNEDNAEGPRLVTYEVTTSGPAAGTLVEKVQEPDPVAPTNAGWSYCAAEAPSAAATCRARLVTRTLATGVDLSGTPLFTFYDQSGVPIPTGPAGVGSSDLGRILSLELTLRVDRGGAARPGPTTFVQRVLLTNSHVYLRPTPGATP